MADRKSASGCKDAEQSLCILQNTGDIKLILAFLVYLVYIIAIKITLYILSAKKEQ